MLKNINQLQLRCIINDILSFMTDRHLDNIVYMCSATVITTSPQYSISVVVRGKYEEKQFLCENDFRSFSFHARYPVSWYYSCLHSLWAFKIRHTSVCKDSTLLYFRYSKVFLNATEAAFVQLILRIIEVLHTWYNTCTIKYN